MMIELSIVALDCMVGPSYTNSDEDGSILTRVYCGSFVERKTTTSPIAEFTASLDLM